MPILLFYITNFLINTTPVNTSTNKPVAKDKYVFTLPVDTANITFAISISSSPSFLLSGVESLSGTSYSFLSSEISAVFVFNAKFSGPFIQVRITSTVALSPGCNNVFSNCLVDITLFPSSVQFGLSAESNLNPSGT